jgi:hypothetical protein
MVLAKAIDYHRQSVAACPANHPLRLRYLSNLVGALVDLYDSTGDEAALDEALVHAREVLAAGAVRHPDRPVQLTNLGAALDRKYTATGTTTFIDEAIRCHEEALTASRSDDSRRFLYLSNLAWALLKRDRSNGVRSPETGAGLAQAAKLTTQPVSARVRSSDRWGTWAAEGGDWVAAEEAFASAVGLLPVLANTALRRDDQEHRLRQVTGVARDAAACALWRREIATSVTLLEHGRAVLLTQLLDARRDTELRARDAELADLLEQLREKLDAGIDDASVVASVVPYRALSSA